MTRLEPGQLEFTAAGTPFVAQLGAASCTSEKLSSQAQALFLEQSALLKRWQGQDRFVILETSFGLGLNFLLTWQAWHNAPQHCRRLHFISFCPHPLTATDLGKALAAWPALAEYAKALQAQWPLATPGIHRLYFADHQVTLTLVLGDPATELRAINASVDTFFLNSNTVNLFTPFITKALARLTAPDAHFVCTTTTTEVQEALLSAEFAVEYKAAKDALPATLAGHFRSRRPNRHQAPNDRRVIVIGSGLAGSTVAYRFAAAGWQVTVLEKASAIASGASSNIAGVLRPLPSADDNRLSRLTRAGFLAIRQLLNELPDARWSACGVMHLAREAEHEAQQQRTVGALNWPKDLLQFVDQPTASEQLKLPVDQGGWWFPSGGWVQPPALCRAALTAFPDRIKVQLNATVHTLKRAKTEWQAFNPEGELLAEAPFIIMASGVAAPRFEQFSWLPQVSARGQISHLPATVTPPLDIVVWKIGYATPLIDGQRLIGASLAYDDDNQNERLGDHRDNLARINLALPGFTKDVDPSTLHGHVGFRPMSPDRLPIVGPVPSIDGSKNHHRAMIPTHPGLWCAQGYGARGIVWSALMADLLLSRIEGEPLPLESDLVDALDPSRFIVRKSVK